MLGRVVVNGRFVTSPRAAARDAAVLGTALGVLVVAAILLVALPLGVPVMSRPWPLVLAVGGAGLCFCGLSYAVQLLMTMRAGGIDDVEGVVVVHGRAPSPYLQIAKIGDDSLSHLIAAHLYEERRLTRVSGCVLDSSHAVQLEGLEEVAGFRTASAPELIAIDCWMGWPRKRVFEAEFLFVCRTQDGRGLAMYVGVYRNRSELDFIRAFPSVEEALAFAGSS